MTFLRKLFGLPEKSDGVIYERYAMVDTCKICNATKAPAVNECIPPLESEGAIYEDLREDGQYSMIVVLSCRKCGTLVKFEGTSNKITTFKETPDAE